jgi:translation initiation factor 1
VSRDPKKERIATDAPSTLSHNPFGALQALKSALPEGAPAPKPDAKKAEKKGPPKAVVRMERAGRNGKIGRAHV